MTAPAWTREDGSGNHPGHALARPAARGGYDNVKGRQDLFPVDPVLGEVDRLWWLSAAGPGVSWSRARCGRAVS